jgi:Leucine-rich repeat (LRR) protein
MNPILENAVRYTIENDPDLKDKFVWYKSDIKRLRLWNKDLTELPEGIKEFPNLEVLDLTKNRLAHVPDWIVSMEKLRLLVVNHNCLENFPPLPPNLEDLSLNYNKLSTFPSLRETKLITLDITHNELISLPEFPFPPTLKQLDLSHNKITRIPNTLQECQVLDLWEMVDNQLSALPPVFSQLHMRRLVLNRNRFETFPIVIKEMDSLDHVELLHNQIRELPQGLRLKSLGINGNPCRLPEAPEIAYIDVRDCSLHRRFMTKK